MMTEQIKEVSTFKLLELKKTVACVLQTYVNERIGCEDMDKYDIKEYEEVILPTDAFTPQMEMSRMLPTTKLIDKLTIISDVVRSVRDENVFQRNNLQSRGVAGSGYQYKREKAPPNTQQQAKRNPPLKKPTKRFIHPTLSKK